MRGRLWPTFVVDRMRRAAGIPSGAPQELTLAVPDDVKNAPDENQGRTDEQSDRDPYRDGIALRRETSSRT